MQLTAATGISARTECQPLFTPPQISLPKGGAAIRGIDEKFAANSVAGTGTLSVALALSPRRFASRHSVEHDSGHDNRVFDTVSKVWAMQFDIAEIGILSTSVGDPVVAIEVRRRGWRPGSR